MKATVLFTGGKDSHYALYWALHQGFDVVVLSSIIPLYEYSPLYHKPELSILELQAKCLSIDLEYEFADDEARELLVLRDLLKRVRDEYGVEAVFSGAILSDFQRMRFSMIAEELGLKSYTPLWRINQEKYMWELVEHGFEILILSINTMGLPLELVGRILSRDDVELIIEKSKRYGFNPAFEGGEAETLVVYMPHYRGRIRVVGRKVFLSPYEAKFLIEDASGCTI